MIKSFQVKKSSLIIIFTDNIIKKNGWDLSFHKIGALIFGNVTCNRRTPLEKVDERLIELIAKIFRALLLSRGIV